MRTARRRHNDERVLARRLALPRYWWALGNPRRLGIVRATGTVCSCWGCTHGRRHYGPSMQERRAVAWMEQTS